MTVRVYLTVITDTKRGRKEGKMSNEIKHVEIDEPEPGDELDDLR